MLELKVEHFDELEDILFNLEMVTYFYYLVENDGPSGIISDGEFKMDFRAVYTHIYNILHKNVSALANLLESEDFAKAIE